MDPSQPQDQFKDQSLDQDQRQSTPKQSVVARVQQATNVLVTVRSNPSVDELAAAIGLTLMLNKLGKHATAVFSGKVPSTLEFLKPEDTIEQNTDSLRDFIVSLDKSKADKLRYKVEENVVKIFITPYRTSISEQDLEFTQGDFNVDVVMALGVTVRDELDQAITAHGRILHDATVVTITAGQNQSELGALNWQEPAASSLSEMLVSISEAFQGGLIDEQIATAFLTGIVAETERFKNAKTSPKIMTMAAQLMAAGANQQLIANELQKDEVLQADQPVEVPHDEPQPLPAAAVSDDGSLTINHDDNQQEEVRLQTERQQPQEAAAQPTAELPEVPDEKPQQERQYLPPSEPQHQDPSLEVMDNIEGNEEAFVSPLLPSEGEESYDPLLPGSQPPDGLIAPDNPVDIFAPIEHAPVHEDKDSSIHIDEHGNMVRREKPLQPHHKVVSPLQAAPGPDDASLDAELANLSSLLTRPEIHAEISDVKATDPGQPFPESTGEVPELDLPTLPNAGPPYDQPMPPGAQPASNPEAAPQPAQPPAPEAPAGPEVPDIPDETTLLDIEKTVHSPHLGMDGEPAPAAGVDTARNAVDEAISRADYNPDRPQPRVDLGAQPLGMPSMPPQPVLNGVDPSAPAPAQQHDNTLPPPPPIPPPMFPQQ
ncbi:MAG: hypothetical protein WAQ57_04400 [Candidatus Saccharimonadales bacterium]